MNFNTLFETTPLGTIVSFSDGTPQPPRHHKKKLRDWQNRNGTGRLVKRCEAKADRPGDRKSIMLETGRYGSEGVIVMVMNMSFDENTTMDFAEVERLREGTYAIISDSIHTGRTLHAVRDTLAEIEAEKERGFRPDHYRIAQIGALGCIGLSVEYA